MIGPLAALAVSMQPLAIPAIPAPRCSPRRESPTTDAADAISILAHMDEEADVEHLCGLLRLPGLPRGLAWQGPAVGWQQPRIDGSYEPRNSAFGIARVVLTWDVGAIRDAGGHARLSNALTIIFSPGKCPTLERLSSAMGVAPTVTEITDERTFVTYRSEMFDIPQPRQDPVTVLYYPCRIVISHVRDL